MIAGSRWKAGPSRPDIRRATDDCQSPPVWFRRDWGSWWLGIPVVLPVRVILELPGPAIPIVPISRHINRCGGRIIATGGGPLIPAGAFHDCVGRRTEAK